MDDSENFDQPSGAIGYILLPIGFLILVGVGYALVPNVRDVIDMKLPWFRDKAGHYLVADGTPTIANPSEAPADSPRPFDLAVFATTPAAWPPSLTMKISAEFPLVYNEKEVGKIKAPAGSEVHLKTIQNGKLGVEFHGGGKWVNVEDTDLLERVRTNSPAPAAPIQ